MRFAFRIHTAFVPVATAILITLAPPVTGAVAEMEMIAGRILTTLVEDAPSTAEIGELRSTLLADGTWPDVDYTDSSRTGWSPTTHLVRLRNLARAHAAPAGPLEGDPGLRSDALQAYNAWIARDPTSSNWWHNQISTPQKIGETLMLLEPHLSAGQLADGLGIVARARVPRSTNSGTNTGANRIDRAYPGILRGLLDDDQPLLRESYGAIGDTIKVTTAEGVQPDFSYQQHGPQLYIQGYGLVYVSGVLRYGGWAAGTSFGYEPMQQRVLVDFLLDGVHWFVRGDTVDFTATGRGLTREGQTATAAPYLAPLADAMAVGGGYRLTELQNFAQRLTVDVAAGGADPSTALVGHRHFWRSDATTFHRPDFSVFLKTSSTRTRQPESGNDEGLKNLHLADGVTLIQRDGDEYDDIMPLWNWRTLPGTTTEQAGYSLKPGSDWGVSGTSTHAGGVSDGIAGTTAFAYQRLGVSAKKSWFFLGERMVALGAALEAPDASNPVLTTVNQCLLDGPVTYATSGGSSSTLVGDQESAGDLEWVHHDGLGYSFPGGSGPAILVGETRTGSWSSINANQSADPVTAGVFALHLDHGHPVSGGGYAYVVAPVENPAAMTAHTPDDIVIERNDGVAQAVRDPSVTAVNFWAAGTAADITVDHSCSVLVRNDGVTLEVSVSDPSQALGGDLVVEIDASVAGTLHTDTGVTVESESPGLRLRAAMGGTQGRSLHARFFLRPHAYQRIELPAVADGFVYDRYPDTAYGDGETVIAKLIDFPDWNRLAYFRFDLSSLPGPAVEATIRLSTIKTQTPGLQTIQLLSETGWTESSLTWNDRPEPIGPPLSPWLPVAGRRIGVDVTTGATGTTLGVAVTPLTRTNDGLTTYATRENTDAALRPALEVMVARPETEIWRLEQFGDDAADPAIAGDEADPDHDGLANAIEFVLGTAPDADSSARHPAGWVDGGNYVFSFRRSHASAGEDVFVEASTDLASWSRLEDGVDEVSFSASPEPGEDGMDRVEVSLPLDGPRQFLRLGIAR